MKETIGHLLHCLRIDLRKITGIFVEHTGSKEMLKPSEQRVLNAVFDMFHQHLSIPFTSYKERKGESKDGVRDQDRHRDIRGLYFY